MNSKNLEIFVKTININDYIILNKEKLLPDWQQVPKTIIFLFFRCQHSLNGSNLKSEEIEKERLLLEFYTLGKKFYYYSQNQKILSEVICPKTGFPIYSNKGKEIFITQQLVKRYLPSFKVKTKECGLFHPLWGQAVYPCIILSGAELTINKSIISAIT